MRFICAGDLHLGAGADLGLAPGDRLAEQEAVLARIVAVANELDATLLFAGDAWERRRPTPEELLAFRRPLESVHGEHGYGLRRAGLVIPGNHDVEAFGRATGYDAIETGRHWHLVNRPGALGLGDAQIACLPWAPPSHLVALEEGGDRDDLNRRLAEGLVDIARGIYVALDPSRPRILLAHWSVSGASVPSGIPVETFREPVLDQVELSMIGFDAIVLGHIHRPQILTPDVPGISPMFYVGSPMPLNFGETGCDHGVYLLDVEPGKAEVYFVPIESRRLVTKDVDLASHPDAELDLGDVEAWALDATVKLRIRATPEQARRLDVAALRAEIDLAAYKVWAIQVEVQRSELVRGPAIDETIDDYEAFRLWLEASGTTVSPVDGPLPDLEEDLLTAHAGYLEELAR